MNFSDIIIASLIPRNQFDKSSVEEAYKELAKNRINADYFSGNYQILYNIVSKQFLKESILDSDILEANLNGLGLNDQKKTEIKILYHSCREQIVPIDKLKEILPEFVNQINTIKFSNSLLNAGKILTEGSGKLKGLADAKKFLIGNIANLKGTQNTPEGAIQDLGEKFWENYNEFEQNPSAGVKTGFKNLDNLTNGLRRGELATIAGYTGHGKSQILRNFFYYSSVFQGKNSVFITLEMPMKQIINCLSSIHSLHPKFGFDKGIEVLDINNSRLNPEDKLKLKDVVDDWKNIPGIMYIKQMPYGTTVSSIREFLSYLNTIFPIDCVYIDYAGLLSPERDRPTVMSEVANIYNGLKGLALDFNGEGIACWSGWQISTHGLEQAERSKDKRYTLGALADSASVARDSDLVISALFLDEFSINHEIKLQTLKYRGGPLIQDWWMVERFNYSKLDDMTFSIAKINEEMTADTTLLD